MKKNKALRIAVALLVVVLVTTCGMTGALAKYVDAFTIDSSTVRAGLFKVTGPASTYTTFEVAIYDGDLGPEAEALGYTGLYSGSNNDEIIVPGSAVKVNGFKVVNLSEVDVTVSVTGLTVTNALSGVEGDVTLWYKVGTGAWQNTPPTAGQLVGATADLDSFPKAAGGGTNELTLNDFYILWPFEATGGGKDNLASGSTDINDTDIGKTQAAALLTGANDAYVDAKTSNIITVGATVNAVQKD